MENTIFLKKFIVKITLFAFLWGILSPVFNIGGVNAEYTTSINTHTNTENTLTGMSNFTTSTGTWGAFESGILSGSEVNIFTGSNLDFVFELDTNTYSGVLINYDYTTQTGGVNTFSGSFIYTGGLLTGTGNQNIFTYSMSGSLDNFDLKLSSLTGGLFHIGIIPGVGEIFEDYMTGSIENKVIDYEFIVDNNGFLDSLNQTLDYSNLKIDYISLGYEYESYTGSINNNRLTLVMSGANFIENTYNYNIYYNTGSENILFGSGEYYKNENGLLYAKIDLKNIPIELTNVSLVMGLFDGGVEYLTDPYNISFDTSLPIINIVSNTSSGEVNLSGQKVLMGSGQGMHYWVNYSDRFIDKFSYKVDGIDATLSGNSVDYGEGCIIGTGGLVYGTMGPFNISIAWDNNYDVACLETKNYITGEDGETHTLTIYGQDKLGRDLLPSNLVYSIDYSIGLYDDIKIVPLDDISNSGTYNDLYNTGTLNIIDYKTIILSGSLDFLGSQSWEVLDTFGPPTHYFFTESGSTTELARIPYNSFSGQTISFENSMYGKTIQIWGDFSEVGCSETASGSCQNIKLTTSGIGFNNGSFDFNGEEVIINLNNFVKPHCGGECEVIPSIVSPGIEMMINLSGSVYPNGIPSIGSDGYTESWTGSYFNIYVNDILTSTGNAFMWRGSNNITDNNTLGYNFLSGALNGDILDFKVGIVNSNGTEYLSNVLSLTIDSEKPTIQASYTENNDGTFTLSATGSDNSRIEQFYWFDEYNNSWDDYGYLDYSQYNSNFIGSGSNTTFTPDRTEYYAVAQDLAGNLNYTKLTLEITTPQPENLTLSGITQTGATFSWDKVKGATEYIVYLNGTGATSIGTGTTYNFDNLDAGKRYFAGVIAKKGEFSSIIANKEFTTLGNGLNLTINVDEKCLALSGEYQEWLSVNLNLSGATNWNDYKYSSKELTSTQSTILFNDLKNGEYNYNVWAGKCGNTTGSITVNNTTNQTITIGVGKWIETVVRENTLTGNIVSTYNIELIPNTSNFDWNDSKYAYVKNNTGTILNIGETDFLLKVRDGQTWTNKNIIGIYTGSTVETNISETNILLNSNYGSGDTLTIVIQEGRVLAGNSNIGDGYISLYNSGSNAWVAGGSIRNGQFTIMGIPDGDYKIEAWSNNYKFDSYTENLSINSNITDKTLTFNQKILNISGDFNRQFALEGKRLSLKLNPNANSTGALSFASGSDIIESATYRVFSGSEVTATGNITISGNTDFTNISGKTITVDLTLKNTIPSDIDFIKANFRDLELSLPIVRINYNSPATVLANTDFKVVGSAPANSFLQLLYVGNVIGTGTTNNNGSFEITSKITSTGNGALVIKDITNNVTSESSSIEVGSDLPILSSYDIKVNDTSRASSNAGEVKYFSVWANGHLESIDEVKISTEFTNSPGVTYYVGGEEFENGTISKGTELGYGIKDIAVEYTKNGKTYTQTIAKMVILIDPAGYVYNKDTDERIAGLTANLYELVDADGNRVETKTGTTAEKLSSYRTAGSGYNKDDIINDIEACQGGGESYPCTWEKYDSTGYGEEPNPQITDDEGRYAWMTPTGFYYVEFTSNDSNKYDNFDSQVVFIPPEVTNLDIGISYKSGYSETESSTNYDRIRTWDGSSWGNWSYTCKNSYTGDTCQTAPVVQNVSSGGGGGGYWRPSTTTETASEESNSEVTTTQTTKSEVKKELKDIKSVIKTKEFTTVKYQELTKKLDDRITVFYEKFDLYSFDSDIKNAGNKFSEAYEGILDTILEIEEKGATKELAEKLKLQTSNFRDSLADQMKAIKKIGTIETKTFGKNKIAVLNIKSDLKVVDIIETKIDKMVSKKLNKDFSKSYETIKLRNNFLIAIKQLAEAIQNKDKKLIEDIRKQAIEIFIDFKKTIK